VAEFLDETWYVAGFKWFESEKCREDTKDPELDLGHEGVKF